MRKQQTGFTMIEFMIVVAIIAILAAIAIPQYQQYVQRARWTDNISALGGARMAIDECLQNSASDPAACDTLAELTAGGWTDLAAMPTGKFAAGPATLTPNTAAIVIVGLPTVGGCTVTATPTITPGVVTWAFATTVAAGCSKSTTGF